MTDDRLRILFVGDLIGGPGRRCLAHFLPKYPADLVIANGENAAGGFGITPQIFAELRALGVGVVTSGNHVWNKKEIYPLLEANEERLLRPANYPERAPGRGWTVVPTAKGEVAVINLMGRAFMESWEDPFHAAERVLPLLPPSVRIRLVDFHAEATAEKVALTRFLDGRVSAVIGTHTHVQTADERVLPGGTGAITDVGMTGPRDGVIGIKYENAVARILTGMPCRFTVAESAVNIFNAVLLEIETTTGRTAAITRICEEHAEQGKEQTK